MIPILYEAFEKTFTNNGICRLSDCISCEVTEERNGKYELTFEYPMTGVRFDEIKEGRLVYVTHDENGDCQPFEIYRKSAPISGVVTFYARHISYRLSKVILKPFSVGSLALALVKLKDETFNENPFTFWTDKTTTAKFSVKVPSSIRSVLGGSVGSLLDVYGGEYEFDKFTVKLWNHRGSDNGVSVRYGKNLTSLTQTLDTGSLYNAIVPYWADTSGSCVYGNPVTASAGIKNRVKWNEENGVIMTDDSNHEMEFDAYSEDVTVMDFSEDFRDEVPTPRQLEDKAKAYLAANTPWIANENIKFDFVALWQTEEYKDIAALERVKLCDTVTVEYPALGVSAKAKVVKVVWDALTERYSSVEVGEARTTFGETISKEIQKAVEDRPTITDMDIAIENATSLITGGMGGHVVFNYDANGKPTEIYIMDTEDVNTAVHVLRINVNGIGFSSNGVSGQYRTAWTLDGNFVADFITTGTLSANLIRAGVLASRDGQSYWDLDDSKFRFYDDTYDSYVEMDKGYVALGRGGNEFGRLSRWVSGIDQSPLVGVSVNGSNTVMSAGPEEVELQAGPNAEEPISIFRMLNKDDNKYALITVDNIAGGYSLRIDKTQNYARLRNGTQQVYLNHYGTNNYLSLIADDDSFIRIDKGQGFINAYSGAAFVRIHNNNTNQFIDLNSDGDQRYIRIDGKDNYTLVKQDDEYIRVDGSTNRITMHHQSITGSPVLTDTGGNFSEIKKIYLAQNNQGTPFLMCQSADGSTYTVALTTT